MSDIENTSIGYSGEVTISVLHGDKYTKRTLHNAGLPNIFRILSNALVGRNSAGDVLTYLDLRYLVTGSGYKTCLVSLLPLSGRYVDKNDSGQWVVKATAAIPYSSLIRPASKISTTNFRLYLVSRNKEDLASLSVDKGDLESMTPGTQAFVDWTLKIQNLNGSQNE